MIETTTNKMVYVVADNPVFAFPIPFFVPGDIHCYLYDGDTETELVRDDDFTVEVKADYSSGANVTLLVPLVSGNKLTIVREVPLTQDVNLPEYGKLPTAPLEAQLDKFIMICQQLKEVAARSFAVPHGMDDYDNDEIYNAFRDLVNNAETWAEEAQAGANNAAASANAASGSSNTAQAHAVSAANSASNAAVAAESAAESAVNAGSDADEIRELAEEANLNRVTLDYGDWGADGTALISYDTWMPTPTIRGAAAQIAEHNAAPDTHTDIRNAINTAKSSAISEAETKISTHNSNANAHSSIRTAVSTAQTTANNAQTTANNATPNQTTASGTSWTRRWNNNWIEYRFTANITTSGQTVTLPVAMANTSYFIAGNCLQEKRYASCYSKTTTSFKVYTGDDATFNSSSVEFLVIGKAAS